MTPEGDKRSEHLWVLRAQVGDRHALDQLLQQVTPRISRFLRMTLKDATDVEDVLQETLLIVCRKIRWLREPQYLNAWVYRIAGRETLRFIRRRTRSPQVHLTEEEWELVRHHRDATRDAAQRVMEMQTLEKLNELPPAARAVLSLHYIEGLTIEEAAEHLDIPVGTAKSRLSFGIQKLKRRLDGRRKAPKDT